MCCPAALSTGDTMSAPDNGFCESVLFWHVREGHYGDVKLDNLSFVRVGRWEGDLWARKATGVAGLYIDDHADDRQMGALPAIIGGRAGGFPGWVNECFAGGRQSRGIERANITYEIAPDLGHWGVEIVGRLKAWAKAIIGPTSPPGKYPQLMNAPGSETGPGPQLVTWGKSTIPLGRRVQLQVRVHAEFGQAHRVRLGRTLTDRAPCLGAAPRQTVSHVGRRGKLATGRSNRPDLPPKRPEAAARPVLSPGDRLYSPSLVGCRKRSLIRQIWC